ncbi:Putative spore maturation protein A [Candidatus Arthromitus sp. SFB-5]|nr:Putative spore maturation protein A [Candidatus Arthromitus sp. SFB-5]
MINYIWFFMIGSGLIYSLIGNNGDKISKSIVDSTSSTVTLIISLIGVMCLWCGIMKIAEESGLTKKLASILRPMLRLLLKKR